MPDLGEVIADLSRRVAALEADPHAAVQVASSGAKQVFADGLASVSERVRLLEAKPSLEPEIQSVRDAVRDLQIGHRAAAEALAAHSDRISLVEAAATPKDIPPVAPSAEATGDPGSQSV